MNLDILLTGAVVLVAFIYIVRRLLKPGCSGCASKECGGGKRPGQCPPLDDLGDKEHKDSQG
ncbi:MAG: hypothetical protein PF568_05815 [Deltaproteobacteria bacterium]|jgi:hypothetical protein|nr:hypothetical protein [Deltaproteobacteria bacterium]